MPDTCFHSLCKESQRNLEVCGILSRVVVCFHGKFSDDRLDMFCVVFVINIAFPSRLSKRIFLFGVANLALCPFILLYEVLYSFFRYAEVCQ